MTSDASSPSPEPWPRLDGRVFVITGAASGIGLACAELLTGLGGIVLGADIHEAPPLSGDIGGVGANQPAWCSVVDVADREAMFALARRAHELHGRLDGWVNSAGVMTYGPVTEITEPVLDSLISINLKGTLWGCQAALSVMEPQGFGSIVNLSSAAADKASPGRGTYGMTKAAVVQLTRVLAMETAATGIRVNAIAPGLILTGITAQHFSRPDGSIDEDQKAEVIQRFAEAIPMKRIGAPIDIAYAAHYLLSDASKFVTGQVLRPNGGFALG